MSRRLMHMLRKVLIYGTALLLEVALVVAALGTPVLIPAIPLALVAAVLIGRGWGRLLLYVLGALFVFQSGEDGALLKMAYLAVALVVISIATVRSLRHVDTLWGRPFRTPMFGTAILTTVIAIAMINGLSLGMSPASVVRDATTYILVAGGVPIALDAAAEFRLSAAQRLVVLVTVIAGTSFAVTFLTLRGVSSLTIDRIGLASMMALSIGVSLSLVRGLGQQHVRWMWLLYGGLLIGLVLLTGSRTGLVLFAAFAGVLGLRASGRVPLTRALSGAVGLGAVIAAILWLASVTVTSAEFLLTRVEVALTAISGGASTDASGVMRAQATQYALDIWSDHPAFGWGFGQSYPSPKPGVESVEFQLDTPALFLAKFGVVGTLMIVAAMILIIQPAFAKLPVVGRIPEQTVATGALCVWLTTLIFGATTEDKGFSLAVLLCILLMAASYRERLDGLRDRPNMDAPGRESLDRARLA